MRGRQLARQPADGLGVDATHAGHGLGREVGGQLAHGVEAGHVLGRATQIDEAFGEQHVDHGHEEVGVAARADGDVLVGLLGRLGALGVDDDDAPAPLADALQPAGPVGRRGQRAVGCERVGAQDQQVVGAVEVGDGEAGGRPEHQRRADLFGPLVHGAGRVDVARAQGPDERLPVEQPGQVVDVGVAQIDRHRVPPVLLEDRRQAALDLGEGLVPRRRLQRAGGLVLDQRCTQPVGILVQLLEGRALGTDVAAAERVLPVTPDAADGAVVADLDLEAAGRLTERAGPEVRGHASNARAAPPAFPNRAGRPLSWASGRRC